MYIEKVQSDRQRAIICQAAPKHLPDLMAQAGLRMSPLVVETIKLESQPFLERYRLVLSKMAELKAVSAEKIEAFKRLQLYVRHARTALDKRVSRGEMKDYQLSLYGTRKGTKWEQATTQIQWIVAAKELVQGEELGTADGLEPLAEPKAFELETLYKHAQSLMARADGLDHDLMEIENLQRPVRKELNQLINELRKMIVLETRNNKVVWRVLLRAAGYKIRYHLQPKEEDGETPKRPKRRQSNNPFLRRTTETKAAPNILDELMQRARAHHRAMANGEQVGPLELPKFSSLRRAYTATLPEPETSETESKALAKAMERTKGEPTRPARKSRLQTKPTRPPETRDENGLMDEQTIQAYLKDTDEDPLLTQPETNLEHQQLQEEVPEEEKGVESDEVMDRAAYLAYLKEIGLDEQGNPLPKEPEAAGEPEPPPRSNPKLAQVMEQAAKRKEAARAKHGGQKPKRKPRANKSKKKK